ncbi:hypothetical protein DTO169C6_4663 [Paecilomyces variotii]|nr:hypothetical protein DTO169C6_4663 [Paecilomyces variotii]KAJ9361035.1 hypothetical protein DTO027B9_884 [Paecilomyces variotii]
MDRSWIDLTRLTHYYLLALDNLCFNNTLYTIFFLPMHTEVYRLFLLIHATQPSIQSINTTRWDNMLSGSHWSVKHGSTFSAS